MPEITDIVQTYEPELLWLDGDWGATSDYWYARKLLKWIYNNSPTRNTIVTNDRWGVDSREKHGDYFTILGNSKVPTKLLNHKFERGISIDPKSWGYRKSLKEKNLMTSKSLVRSIVSTVSQGGNILINVGLKSDGTIVTPVIQRLKEIGM